MEHGNEIEFELDEYITHCRFDTGVESKIFDVIPQPHTENRKSRSANDAGTSGPVAEPHNENRKPGKFDSVKVFELGRQSDFHVGEPGRKHTADYH